MANLIIIIIFIALVAVATVMAVYYGGTAFNTATMQGYANTLISEGRQLHAINTKFMIDNGYTNFEDFDNRSYYYSFTPQRESVPILGSRFFCE